MTKLPNGKIRPEYNAWLNMIKRCHGKNAKLFTGYGGRGIRVCDRWRRSFKNFLADMGPRPSDKHSLDRKRNNEDYGPDNCRWATAVEQSNNCRQVDDYINR